MKKQGIFYSLMILCASNLGLQGMGFLYRIGLSRLAGAEGLGMYHLAYSVYAVVHAACLSGSCMACSRMSAELSAAGHEKLIGSLAKKVGQTFLFMLLSGSIILFFWRNIISGNILGDDNIKLVFPVMIVCLLLTGVENIVKSICIGLDKVKWAASAELTEQIVRMMAVLGLLAFFGASEPWKIAFLIFVGMSISECVSAAMLWNVYRSKIRVKNTDSKPLTLEHKHEFSAIILPITGAALISNIIASASSFILPTRLMLSGLTKEQALSEIGIISSMAMPLLILPIALISSLCTVIMPAISRSKTCGNIKRTKALTYKALSLTGLIGIPLTALIVPLAPTLSRLFFGQPLELSYVALLGLEIILIYYQMVMSGILNGLGAQKQVVRAAVSGEILQLVLVWVLAAQPSLGIYGFIISKIIAEIYTDVVCFICLCRCLKLKEGKTKLFAVPIFCGITIFLWVRVLYTFFLGIVGFQWLGIVCAGVTSLMLCIFILYLLGVRLSDYIKTGKMDTANMMFMFY